MTNKNNIIILTVTKWSGRPPKAAAKQTERSELTEGNLIIVNAFLDEMFRLRCASLNMTECFG